MDQILVGLFPAKCPCCGEFCASTGLCDDCFLLSFPREAPRCRVCDSASVAIQAPSRCLRCLSKPRNFERMWGCFDYAGPVGQAIKNGKNKRRPEYLRTAAQMVVAHLPKELDAEPPDVIIPVPIHHRRLYELGFSAPATIARSIGRALKRPVWRGAARRHIDTKRQRGLDEEERRRNIKGSFSVRAVEGLDILLVDDVFTTGSTMDELASTIHKAGGLRVRGICAAYVDRETDRVRAPLSGCTISASTVVA